MINLGGLRSVDGSEVYDSNHEPKSVIAFVSKTHAFSDRICRITQAELNSVNCVRFVSLDELVEALPTWQDSLRMIVTDECTAVKFDREQAMMLSSQSGARIACAYANEGKARKLLSSNLYPDVISSVFPLDLNLDAWISMLKFCKAGHTYIKTELLQPPQPEIAQSDAADVNVEVDVEQTGSSDETPKKAKGGDKASGSKLDRLTKREWDVLIVVAKGYQNKTIADKLGLSENTVKLHIHHIISKLGVHNRTEAAMIYARHTED